MIVPFFPIWDPDLKKSNKKMASPPYELWEHLLFFQKLNNTYWRWVGIKIIFSNHICDGNMIVPFFPIWDQHLRSQINNENMLTVGAEMVAKK